MPGNCIYQQVFAKEIVQLPEQNFHKAFFSSPSRRRDVDVVLSRCLLIPAYLPASGSRPITARLCLHLSICHPPAENDSFPSLFFFFAFCSLFFFAFCSLPLCNCAGPFFFFAFIFQFFTCAGLQVLLIDYRSPFLSSLCIVFCWCNHYYCCKSCNHSPSPSRFTLDGRLSRRVLARQSFEACCTLLCLKINRLRVTVDVVIHRFVLSAVSFFRPISNNMPPRF